MRSGGVRYQTTNQMVKSEIGGGPVLWGGEQREWGEKKKPKKRKKKKKKKCDSVYGVPLKLFS